MLISFNTKIDHYQK